MRDDQSKGRAIIQGMLIAGAAVLVAIALAVGLFFGICSMIRP